MIRWRLIQSMILKDRFLRDMGEEKVTGKDC
jgi:hypothetical protein